MSDAAEPIDDNVPVHRVGGASAENLSLKPPERTLIPPSISMLCGGSPAEAAETMRRRFPRMAPRGRTMVGSTTAGQIRQAGFDVIMDAIESLGIEVVEEHNGPVASRLTIFVEGNEAIIGAPR